MNKKWLHENFGRHDFVSDIQKHFVYEIMFHYYKLMDAGNWVRSKSSMVQGVVPGGQRPWGLVNFTHF